NRAGRQRQAIGIEQVRHIAQKLKYDPLALVGIAMDDWRYLWRFWWLWFHAEFVSRCRRRSQVEQFLFRRLGDRNGHPGPLAAFPELVEFDTDVADVGWRFPRIEDRKRFVVVFQRLGRFVDAPRERDLVSKSNPWIASRSPSS